MAFEGEQVFAGLEDRLDSLADRGEVRPLAGFVFAAGSDDGGVEVGGGVFERLAGVAFVADDGQRAVLFDALEQGEADVAFRCLGGGERPTRVGCRPARTDRAACERAPLRDKC